jgi:2-furoyl-CoA dehydrogenase large subunit
LHTDPGLQQALPKPHLGQSAPRHEDAALLTGRGRFGDDLGTTPGTLHAAVLRSPHAHARLLGVDTAAALALPGVHAVLTGQDVQRWQQPFVVGVKVPMQHYVLAVDKVRYAGEPVAVVVAQDRYIAEDALDLLRADYEALPAVVDIEAACDAGAAVLHEAVGSNVVSDRSFCYGDPDAAFAAADRRVALTVHYPRNSCTPIEGAVVIAECLAGGEGYEVTSNFMGPFSLHSVMALALGVPANKLRHKLPRDSGGSFGVKQAVLPYVVLMCLASKKAGGAPVKWVEDRLEHLAAATSATARLTHIEAAVQADGRITALRWDQRDDVGAYLRAPEPATFYRMHGALSGAYDIKHIAVRNRVVLTSKTPTGLVRGFGGPQVYYALERLMDRIAVELGMDAIALRQRNFVQAAQFPYHAAAGAVLDSGDYARLAELAQAAALREGLQQRQAQARAAGRLYGIGVAAIVEPSVSNMGYISTVLTAEQRAKAGPKNGAIASATVGIDLLGGLNVVVASAPAGQGHITVCAQVVADVFGLQPEQVAVCVDFDTAKDAWSVAAGNYSSRFAGAVAGTVHLAAMRLRDKLTRIAAAQFGCAAEAVVFEGGKVFDRAQPARALAFSRMAAGPHWAPALLPEGVEPGLRETAFWTPPTLTAPDAQDRVNTSACYGFVFDICGLDVDPHTGRVTRRPLHHRPRCRPHPAPGHGRRADPRRFRAGPGRGADGGVPLRRRRRLPERHLRRLPGAHRLRGARPGDRAPADTQPLHAAGCQGHRRRQQHEHAGVHRQCLRRRAAPAEGRGRHPPAADTFTRAGADRCRGTRAPETGDGSRHGRGTGTGRCRRPGAAGAWPCRHRRAARARVCGAARPHGAGARDSRLPCAQSPSAPTSTAPTSPSGSAW